MQNIEEGKIGDLCKLIANLGKDGGLMSPSIYDTAQVLRYCPPAEGVEPALTWLASIQRLDGGWGDSIRSHTRDIPTIAALLAFATYSDFKGASEIIEAGLNFLEQHHYQWGEVVPEDLPVGMELILPKLISEAEQLGLQIPKDHYQNLIPIYQKKINYIRTMPVSTASAPAFSWEAWGESPDTNWLDELGSVGNSPTATAYWAYLAKDEPGLEDGVGRVRAYLASAEKATRSGIPGVVPTAWPLERFEQSFSLHVLLMAGLLDLPQLQAEVKTQVDDLMSALLPTGIGFNDYFNADGDDTAATVAVLCATGKNVSKSVIDHFAYKDYFLAYDGELQSSHSVTSRAIFALRFFNADTTAAELNLLTHQLPSGAWPSDKWNTSTFYGTCLATFALKDKSKQYEPQLTEAANFLIKSQLDNGSWGSLGVPSTVDTAYALISVLHLTNAGLISPKVFAAGQNWLSSQYASHDLNFDYRWLNKQEYSVYKVDQTFQLAALVALPDSVQSVDSVYYVSLNDSLGMHVN